MIYSHKITIAASKPASDPQHDVLKVTKGFVYKVEVHFPPGCAGLAHIAIFDGGFQCWPSTTGDSFNTDGYCISFDDSYLKLVAPYQFDIYGYNEDDTWPHTIQVRIGMVSSDLFIARFLPTVAYEELLNLIRAEEKAQEERRAEVLETPFPWVEE